VGCSEERPIQLCLPLRKILKKTENAVVLIPVLKSQTVDL